MKFSTNTDFTTLARVRSVLPKGAPDGVPVAATVKLPHDERHLRRRALALGTGESVLIDLPAAVQLADGDQLVLEDGRVVEIKAGEEDLLEVVPRDALHLAELAWHIGNRHMAAEVRGDCILLGRDHVIKAMLEGLGATVNEIVAPFHPLRGAYGGHSHGHGGAHGHGHG